MAEPAKAHILEQILSTEKQTVKAHQAAHKQAEKALADARTQSAEDVRQSAKRPEVTKAAHPQIDDQVKHIEISSKHKIEQLQEQSKRHFDQAVKEVIATILPPQAS